MNNYYVYKHTSPSKKVYIGITNQIPERRWRKDGSGYRQNTRFYNAIKKYGWDSFQHEILFKNLSKEDACKKEIELISEYNSYLNDFGYNQSLGGEHANHSNSTKNKLSESVSELWENDDYRKHMSDVHKGKGRSGWRHTEEAKQKMSEHQKNISKDKVKKRVDNLIEYNRSEEGRINNSNRTKKLWEDEEFRKRNTKHLYGNCYRRKSVLCVETGEVFDTVEKASLSVGVTRDAIGRVCRGLGKTSGGYHWRFADE